MSRWLSNILVGLSLLLSTAAAAGWAMSSARPSGWRLIATAHSPDLMRVNGGEGKLLFATAANWSKTPNHGFWDAWWALSHSGRLTLLAQVVDYDGTLGRVGSSPPSLVVELPGSVRPPAVLFDSMPATGRAANSLGFAFRSDAQLVNGGEREGAPVSARVWVVTLPYWFILLLGLPIPLLRLQRVARTDRRSP